MPDITSGLIPGLVEPKFLPNQVAPLDSSLLIPLPQPDFTPKNYGSLGTGSNSSMDFVSQTMGGIKSNNFHDQSAPTQFNWDDLGAAMYKNADQFKEYGLQLHGDNEELYGKLQTGWDKTKRALSGAWALGKNQFAEQLTSWGDTFNFLKSNKSAFEQSDLDEINSQQRAIEDQNHIFQTKQDQDTFWNWSNIATTVQQSGYALGAIGEIVAEELAIQGLSALTFGAAEGLQGLNGAKILANLRKALTRTEELNDVIKAPDRYRKIFNTINKVNPFLDNTMTFALDAKSLLNKSRVAGEAVPMLRTVGKGFGAFYRDIREVNAAVAEAKGEAAGTQQDLTKTLIAQYKQDHGVDPNASTLQDIKQSTLKAAQTDGIWNTYLIMTTNKIGFGNIMSGIKPLRDLEVAVGSKIVQLSDKAALKAGGGKIMNKLVDATENKWLAFKQNLIKRPIGYFKTNIDEALQENLQDVIKDVTTNYYAAKYNQDRHIEGHDPMKTMHDYLMTAADNQFTMAGAKTFMSGFFTGAIIGPVNEAFGRVGELKQRISDPAGYTERNNEIKKQRGSIIEAYNEIYNNPLGVGAKVGDASVQANLGELLKTYAQTNNLKGFHDIKDDALRSMILTGIRSGAMDSILARLKSYPETLSNDEFTKAFRFDNTPANLKSLKNQITNFTNRALEIQDLHERMSDRLQNPFNPFHNRFDNVDKTTNPDYIREKMSYFAWNDAVDNLVFMKDHYAQGIKRSTDILTNITKNPGMRDVSFNEVHLLTSTDHVKSEIALLDEEIKGLELGTDKKLLNDKKARLSILEKYHEHLSTWEDEFNENSTLKPGEERDKAFEKSYEKLKKQATPLFSKIINKELKTNNLPLVSEDNIQDSFSDMHDYMQLQKESGSVLDKINLLANPKEFNKFFQDHNDELRYYYQKAKDDAENPITNAVVMTPEMIAADKKKEEELKANQADESTPEKVAITTFAQDKKDGKSQDTEEDKKFYTDNKDAIDKELTRLEAVDKAKKEYDDKLAAIQKAEEDKKAQEAMTAHQAEIDRIKKELEESNKKIQTVVKSMNNALTLEDLNKIWGDIAGTEMANHKLIQDTFENKYKELEDKGKITFELIDQEKQYKEVEELTKSDLEIAKTGKFAAKPDTAYTSTQKQTLNSDTDVLDSDPVKIRFNAALVHFKQLFKDQNISSYKNLKFGNKKGIYVTAINPITVFTESVNNKLQLNDIGRRSLEQNTTVARLDNGLYRYSDFALSSILLLTDENGIPYTFNDVGEFSPNGAYLPFNMRKPYFDKKGELVLTNSKGEQIQSPEERVADIIAESGLSLGEEKILTEQAVLNIAKIAHRIELEKLMFIQKELAKDENIQNKLQYTFPIEDISDGVVQTNFTKPAKISSFDIPDFSPEVVDDARQSKSGYRLGGVYFKVPGYDKRILIIRPRINESQVETILALLFNPKNSFSVEDTRAFLDTMVYTKKNDLQFQLHKGKIVAVYFDKGDEIILTPELYANPGMQISFRNKLLGKKLNISKTSIGATFTNITYVKGTEKEPDHFKTEDINYNDFIKNNFETYIQPNADKKVVPLNAYIKYDPSSVIVDSSVEDNVDKTNLSNLPIDKTLKESTIDKINDTPAKYLFKDAPIINENQIDLEQSGIEDLNGFGDNVKIKLLENRGRNANGQIVGTVRIVGKDAAENFEVFFKEPKEATVNKVQTKLLTIDEQILAQNNALDALLKATTISNEATAEQIKTAGEWYANSPLSKYVPLERLTNVVNSNALAHWTQAGIKLFNGANDTDIYHEAFHGFSQLFLTKDQKKSLYDEVRVLHPEMNDLQAEELLAEDFRKYILSGATQVLDKRPVRNTIWRKMINFLRELFTGVKQSDYALRTNAISKIQEMYEKLRTGNISEFSPSIYNIQFGKLNKGIQLPDGTILSNEESSLINESIDSMITGIISSVKDRAELQNKIKGNNDKEYANILLMKDNRIFRDAIYHAVKLRFDKKVESGDDYQKVISKLISDNFQTVINYHISKSDLLKSSGVSVKIDSEGNIQESVEDGDDSNDNKANVKDSAFDKKGDDSAVMDYASPEVLQLLSGLHEYKDGKVTYNKLGEIKLANFTTTKNRVIKKLQGIYEAQDMFKALVGSAGVYPELAQLAMSLGDPSGYSSPAKFNLWMKFRQPFSMTRIVNNQMHLEIVDKNLTVKFLESRPDIQGIKGQFTSAFQSRVNDPYTYTNPEGNNVLRTQEILNKFTENTIHGDKVLVNIKKGEQFNFLKAIGFNFSDTIPINYAINQFKKTDYIAQKLYNLNELGAVITDPLEQLSKDSDSKNKDGESNNVKQLLEIEARYSDDYSNFSVLNPNGDLVYEHSLNNAITNTINLINDSTSYPTYQDLIQHSEMGRYDVNKNPLIKNSLILNSLFDLSTGLRRKDYQSDKFVTVVLDSLAGAKEITDSSSADTGLNISSFDMSAKHDFDFNSMMQTGKEEMPRHSDKSSYYALSVSTLNNKSKNTFSYLHFPIDKFFEKGRLDDSITTYMKGNLVGELTRIGWLNEGLALKKKGNNTEAELKIIESSGANIEGYNKRALALTIFDGILTSKTKDQLLKYVEKNTPEDIEQKVDNLTSILHEEFKNYFNALDLENWNKKKDNFHIGKDVIDRLSSLLRSRDYKNVTELTKQRILNKAHAINSFVNKLEAYKFIYGDPAFYNLEKEEVNKRIPAFGATKTTLALGQPEIDFVNKQGRLVAKSMGIKEKQFDGTFGVRVYQDNTVSSEYLEEMKKDFIEYYKNKYTGEELTKYVDELLKPYTEMKESDAQGYITLDAWRLNKMLQGQWSDSKEKLYNKEHNGEELTPEELLTFFSVQKAQYAGPLKTDRLYVPAFHKFSLMPLIPSMIRGTNMEQVHKDMMEQGHDYATFQSGSKIATIGQSQPFYEDQKTRKLNLSEDKSKFTTNTVFARFFGEQLQIDPKWKNETIFSTQLRKLVDLGLFEFGIPLTPEAGTLSQQFEKNITRLTDLKKARLIREAKIEENNGRYSISDFGPIVKLIKNEFVKRDMPDNIVDFIDLNENNKIKTPLDLSTQSQKIEGVIQSIINNRLIRQKVHGESLIQLASTGFEKFRNATDNELAKYGTNDLPFYRKGARIVNGKKVTSAMKIKIALTGDYLNLLNLKHTDGQTIGNIDRLNEVIKNDAWLDQGDNRKLITLTGVRIPVQGLNSMEFMEVYHFLPSTAGNIIIPPTEIVAKAGSDFDVDKMSVFKANIAEDGSHISSQYDSEEQITKLIKNEIRDLIGKNFQANLANRESLKALRTYYLNEVKDVLDALTNNGDSDALRPYQNLSIDKLMNNIFNLSKEVNIKDLDDNLYAYYTKLSEIDATYQKAKDIPELTKASIKASKDIKIGKYGKINELFQARRDLIKATENNLNQIIRSILEMDHNYFDLVTPNTTKDVEGLADQLANRNIDYDRSISKITGKQETIQKNGKTIPYVSPTRLFESAYNDYQFLANNSGKNGLGIGAISNTFNNQFNKVGAYLNSNFKTKGGYAVPINILLNHNTTKEGNVSLSNLYDKEGKNKISDIISQLMNGWVDVGKKAWIFNINGGVEGTPVILLLTQIGTPIHDVANYMTQPVIQQYTQLLRKRNNIFNKVINPGEYIFFESQQRLNLMAPLLGLDTKKVYKIGKETRLLKYGDLRKELNKLIAGKESNFSSEALNNIITDKKDKAILLYQYFQLEDIAKKVKDIQSSLNFDTNKAANAIAAQDKKNQFREVLQTNLIPVEQLHKLHDESVMSSFAIQDFNMDFQEQLLPLRNNKEMNNFILDHKEDLPESTRSKNFDKFARVFKNDFMEDLFQNNAIDNSKRDIMSWFHGPKSVANQLYTIKKENPKLLVEYPLLTRFIKDKSKRKKEDDDKSPILDNIKLIDSSLDSKTIDIYHDQFTRLVNPAVMKVNDIDKNLELTKFFNKLAVFGFLQSGLNRSFLSWTEITPQNLYTRLMGDSINSTVKGMHQAILDDFYRKFRRENAGTFGFFGEDDGKISKIPVKNKEPHRYKEFRNVVPNVKSVIGEPKNMNNNREYTPENVTSLKTNEVFVFGSNAEGIHGKGAALLAKQKFGAIQGQSEGLQGKSYAVITKKNWRVEKSSTLNEIEDGLSDFVNFADKNSNLKFYVTKLGSSLAGYSINDIKSLFKKIYDDVGISDNVILPKEYEIRDKINNQITDQDVQDKINNCLK